MTADPMPWYAHEFPDRPLAEGAVLCCCLLCAVALERAGQEDMHRPITFHTGWGPLTWGASRVAYDRAERHLHDTLLFANTPPGNWVEAITVGPRRGRAAKERFVDTDHPYPRPLDRWPICTHCGPLSNATFARLTELGRVPRPRRTAKRLAAEEASRAARATLVADVEVMLARRREDAAREIGRRWRGLQAVPALPPDPWDDGDDWPDRRW